MPTSGSASARPRWKNCSPMPVSRRPTLRSWTRNPKGRSSRRCWRWHTKQPSFPSARSDRSASRGGRQPVAPHHLADRGQIRWTAGRGPHHLRDLTKIGRPENARRDDGKRACALLTKIVEAVHRASRNREHVARANLGALSLDRESHHALEPIDCLFVGIVRVRSRQFATCCHLELEHCESARRVFPFEQEPDFERTNPDLFGHLFSPFCCFITVPVRSGSAPFRAKIAHSRYFLPATLVMP